MPRTAPQAVPVTSRIHAADPDAQRFRIDMSEFEDMQDRVELEYDRNAMRRKKPQLDEAYDE